MRYLLLCLMPLLAGCPGTLAPVIKTEGQEIRTPVMVKCVKSEDLPTTPQFPLDVVDLSNDKEALARLTNAARLERKVRKEYVGKVEEVLRKCSN